MKGAAIVGVGYTDFTRESGRSVLDLATEACSRAIADAGLEPARIQGMASYSLHGDSVPCQAVATALAMPAVPYMLDLSLGGQGPATLVLHAALAIQAGYADAIVCFRALNGRSGIRVGSTPLAGVGGQYRYPLGFDAYPQYMAMFARRYMIETGADERDLAAVAITQRTYAQTNPRAIRRSPLTFDDYVASPYVAEPYRRVDCTVEVDGACAFVIAAAGLARKLPHRPASVRTVRYVCGPRSGLDMGDSLMWDDYSRNFTSFLADELWSSAGVRPGEVDFAQIYDCFTGTVLMTLEGLQLAARGRAADLVRSGDLPINTNGGLLCEGYLHGMNTVTEAVLQLQGRATNQVPGARRGVVTSGGFADGAACILEAGL